MSEVHVKGLDQLQKFLDQLPAKLEANVMRGALRCGMNVIQPVAQANVHSVSGALAKGLKIGTRVSGGTVIARLRATGKHAFIAHMLEFTGAKPHKITAKKGGFLALFGVVRKSVQHPGFKARPFLRPALDGQAQNAVIAVAEYIKKRLATREGIDTADVKIEGDQ